MDYKEMRSKIKAFSLDEGDLGSQGYDRILLQLFGYTGHGKSSFINSCKYVLNDEPFIEYAEAGEKKDGGSMTMIRKSYELTPNITIVDNRGCISMTNFERAEVFAQLGNFHPLDQEVEWKENFNDAMSVLEENELNPNFTDFLVPIFIYSATTVLGEKEKEDVKKFLHNCVKMTGVVPIIVITQKTGGDFLDVERKFKLMGGEVIIAIENYTKENNLKTLGRTCDILMVIDKALKNVRFRLEQPRNPKRDRMERRKFLLNYIHEAAVNRENEKKSIEREKDEKTKKEKENSFCFIL